MRQRFPSFCCIHCALQGPWPTTFHQFSCLHLPSCCRHPGITDVSTTSGLLHGFWDPNQIIRFALQASTFPCWVTCKLKQQTNKQTTKNICPAPYIFMNYKSKVSLFCFFFLFPDPSQNPKPACLVLWTSHSFWRPLSCTCSTSNAAACWTQLLNLPAFWDLNSKGWLSLPL